MLGTDTRVRNFGCLRLEITELFWVQYSGFFAGTSDIIRKTWGFRMIETQNKEVLLYLEENKFRHNFTPTGEQIPLDRYR